MADTNTYVSKQKVEKWTTKEKFNALELATIETGTEYNLTGAIDESDLGSDLQTKINGKLTKPANPSAESAVTMLTDGTVGTKPLTSITGKSEVYVGSTTPTNEDEILWINPDGTSSGGGSSGGGKLYKHEIYLRPEAGAPKFFIYFYNSDINTCTTWEKLWSEKYLNFNPTFESYRAMASLSHIPVSESPGWGVGDGSALVGCSLYCRNYEDTGEHFRLGIAGRYVSSDGVYSVDIPIPDAFNTSSSGERVWLDDTNYTASTWATGDNKIIIHDTVTEL